MKVKNIFACIALFWIWGGGFILGLMCFIWSWKIVIAVETVWMCSCLITFLRFLFKENILYFHDSKSKGEQR